MILNRIRDTGCIPYVLMARTQESDFARAVRTAHQRRTGKNG
ncbi:MAG: hypothetical protein PWP08_958 [Methanofollis sp.]|nr:hypothetical protein [Methanofollis sp.]